MTVSLLVLAFKYFFILILEIFHTLVYSPGTLRNDIFHSFLFSMENVEEVTNLF